MISIQKLRTLTNKRINEIVSIDLVDYSLRTVASLKNFEYTIIDIKYIEIDKSIRGKGLGKQILTEIVTTLFENNVDCIVITASDYFGTDYDKLVNLYTSVGFTMITGGVKGCMYIINPNSNGYIKNKAERDIIYSSRMQHQETNYGN